MTRTRWSMVGIVQLYSQVHSCIRFIRFHFHSGIAHSLKKSFRHYSIPPTQVSRVTHSALKFPCNRPLGVFKAGNPRKSEFFFQFNPGVADLFVLIRPCRVRRSRLVGIFVKSTAGGVNLKIGYFAACMDGLRGSEPRSQVIYSLGK